MATNKKIAAVASAAAFVTLTAAGLTGCPCWKKEPVVAPPPAPVVQSTNAKGGASCKGSYKSGCRGKKSASCGGASGSCGGKVQM